MIKFSKGKSVLGSDEPFSPLLVLARQKLTAEAKVTDGVSHLFELHKRLTRAWTEVYDLTKAISELKLDKHVGVEIASNHGSATIKKRKKHSFEWLRIVKFPEFPDDLMRYILSYINDDDRFRLRGLSILFYESYYSQHVDQLTSPFNDERTIRLAKRGRRFVKIEHLQTRFSGICRADLQYISPYTFPRLKSFYSCKRLNGNEFNKLRHPGLVELSIVLETPSLVRLISEQRFPRLEILAIDFRRRLHPLGAINPHKTLKNLTILKAQVDTNFFKSVSRENFPKLQSIEIERKMSAFEADAEFFNLQRQFNSFGVQLKNISRRRGDRAG